MHVVQGHLSGYVPLPEDTGACLSFASPLPFKLLFKDHIKPDSCWSTIPFHEWMGNVHFNIFGDDFLKGWFGHLLDYRKNGVKVHTVGKAKIPFGDIQGSYFPGKVVQSVKQVFVDIAQSFTVPTSMLVISPVSKANGLLQGLICLFLWYSLYFNFCFDYYCFF